MANVIDGTTLYHNAIDTIHRLRSELAEAKEEIARLKQHIANLEHDLQGTVDDCNQHCSGEGIL